MTPERWQEIRNAFARIRASDPGRRRDGVAALAADDPALAADVEALLAESEAAEAEGFLGITPTEEEADEPGDALTPGERIGPYEIERVLGRGGMGTVYLAMRVEHYRQHVGLKLIHPELMRGKLLRRFHAERQVLALLEHPNIVRLLDGGTTDSQTPYLVMEYIEGENIDDYCEAKQLPVRERVRLILTVARAVAYAHNQGILHRDLKPANVLVTSDGVPKITDFGLARRIRQDDQSTLTEPGAILGTPSYMAPEQFVGGPGSNEQAVDGYALGAILYRLLTGRDPFQAEAVVQAYLRITSEEPTPIRRLNPAVPRDLETIAMKAMAKEPSERFASVDALVEQLGRFLANQPLTIRRPSPITRLGKWTIRHRLALTVWGVTVVVLLAILSGILFAHNQRIREAYAAEALARDRAETNLEILSDLLQRSTLAAEYMIAEVPLGSERTHALLAEWQAFYEEVLDRLPGSRNDPELRYRAALANYHLARSFNSRDADQNRPRTLQHFSRSIDLLEPLSHAHPENEWYRYNLFRGLMQQAGVHLAAGDSDRAERDAEAALQAVEALARDFPANPDWRDAVAFQHRSLAEILFRRGRVADAEGHARRSLEVASQTVEEAPDRPMYLSNVRKALHLLARIAHHRGRLAEAEQLLLRALSVGEELVRHVPDDVAYPIERTEDLRAFALLLSDLGRDIEAVPPLEVALRTAEKYARLYPENDVYLVKPIQFRLTLAEIYERLGRTEDSEALYREAFATAETLLRERPDLASLRILLDRAYAECPLAEFRDPERARRSLGIDSADEQGIDPAEPAELRSGKTGHPSIPSL
ncbi:serine/threonine protein kinase [Tautonia sociabilis]|uniref:Serine/threonine protein kinase n=2 Tax=Tautonia sociabilis TaxID=2080755 RepID=A0A432MFC8_9BACT|nr:serine/threonine protein kinase [Tautonia sociabilis]